jgi:hypothetical protein
LGIDSLSMRGAQREITGWLIKQGYKPDGRWAAEAGVDHETWRRFKLADTTAQRPDKPQGWA